ncbi:MAG: imelysin family protein [Bacteroidetes bacterium]|nr:imelysin family protein [Bacteroidota bacterium]
MTKLFRNIFLFSVLIAILIGSCKKKESEVKTPFDEKAMLGNIGEIVIKPLHQRFVQECGELVTAAQNFSTQNDSANLSAYQFQWKETRHWWKQCEAYILGVPAEIYINFKIDKWPTNQTFIDNNINGISTLNEAFVESQGSTAKGFPAIEYLVFNTNGDSLVLKNFTTDINATRRMDYLIALTLNLQTKATYLLQTWNDYLPDFETTVRTDIYGSLSKLINAQSSLLEQIVNTKLGYPLGKTNGDVAIPESVEDYLSKESVNDIRINLAGIQEAYLCSFGGNSGKGLRDFLNYNEAKKGDDLLSTVIDNKFAECFAALDKISSPLSGAVNSQKTDVEDLYIKIRDLLILYKSNMADDLGVTITFNDNDGD